MNVRETVTKCVVSAAVTGANLALRVPQLRDRFVETLLRQLRASYDSNGDDADVRDHVHLMASHLQPFLRRLLHERPAAARAILRFLGTYIKELYNRRMAEKNLLPAPYTVVIEPTDRCNLFCPGCYAKSSCDGSDLPYERLDEIVQQVADMGVSLITLSGGEPFLREKADRCITRLAEKYSDRGFMVYTNGTLIDEEIARRMQKVGNVFPCISVEGFEHQTDTRRGKGTYEKDRRVRQLLMKHEVLTGFSATITRENCESICTDAFIERRVEEGDMVGWFFLLQPIGRAPRPDLMVTPDQRAMLRETIWRWRTEERPIFLGDFWNDGMLTSGCIAGGTYYFHIYANGDISPCVFSPVACGNIFEIIAGKTPYRDLTDFLYNSPVFKAFRQEQRDIKDRARPCLLIDHPEVFRRICKLPDCRPAKNMAEGYLDGQIAQAIDEAAAGWKAAAANLPPILPAEPVKCETELSLADQAVPKA